jgi:phosphate transporter
LKIKLFAKLSSSHSLKFNAVAEWWADYIAYSALKREIYRLEKTQHGSTVSVYRDIEANEASSLMGHAGSPTDSVFKPLLDRELFKVTTFYEAQERELLDEVEILEDQVERKESQGLRPDGAYMDDDEDDEDDEDDLLSPGAGPMSMSGSGSGRMRSESFSVSPRARKYVS